MIKTADEQWVLKLVEFIFGTFFIQINFGLNVTLGQETQIKLLKFCIFY